MSYFDGLRGETLGSLSVSAREGDLEHLQELLSSDGGRERWRAADNKGAPDELVLGNILICQKVNLG